MTLAKWLKSTKTAQAELGRRVGLTQGRISQIAKRGTVDIRIAREIAAATDNGVTADELLMARPVKRKAKAEARVA